MRDCLVLGLAAAGASLDAWSYFGLGHVFVANMTGNTVLLGFSLASGERGRIASASLAICAYAVGVFVGAFLARPIRRAMDEHEPEADHPQPWPARLTGMLVVEGGLIIALALVALVCVPVTGGHFARALIPPIAFAVGLQSAAMVAMKLPGVVTTYITGTWTLLVSGAAQLLDGEEVGTQRKAWEERLLLQAGVLVVYCGAALLNGLVFRFVGARYMGCLPAGLILLVVVWAAFGTRHGG